MTITEAAKVLGLSPATLRKQIERGSFRASKLGPKLWVTTEEDVEAYRRDHLGQRRGGPRPKRRHGVSRNDPPR